MPLYRAAEVPARLLAPGFHARPMHGDALTVMHVEIDAGADLPRHQHPHEQAVTVLRGCLLLTVGDAEHELRPGMTLFIPGNVPHHARCPEPTAVLDVFSPVREDLR